MTLTTNGHDHTTTTHSGDVRMRVRVTKTPPTPPIRPDSTPRLAHARAIPPDDQVDKGSPPGKIRNFVQLHAGEAVRSADTSWLATRTPQPLNTTARAVIPTRAEAGNPGMWVCLLIARTFQLAVHAVAYLLHAATDTDIKAGVALGLTTCTTIIVLAVTALAGH